ncbi:MAG: alpha-amylase family glycosyl hydrolase [Candidatus Saccharimonadales bacterium]
MSDRAKKQLGVHLSGSTAEFRVWAPFANSVALIGTFSEWEEIAMQSTNEGIWSVTVENVEPGQSYKYRIANGGNVFDRIDPRAHQLSESENGASIIIDPNSYEWRADVFTVPPKNEQIIYELHVGTFHRPDAATQGTFDSAIEKLDYLKELGINMVELMPITSMATGHGWGYAPNHLYSVESSYGGRHGLLRFVDECHQRGLGVILDVVYNHFSTQTNLWQFDGWNEKGRGGIYFYNDERGYTPWGGRPDYGRQEVRDFILDNVTMWLNDYRIDGLRIDSTIYMRNTNGWNDDPEHDIPDAWKLLGDIVERAHSVKPQSLIIAEDFAINEYITKPISGGGLAFDAQWELGFPHAIRSGLGLNYGAEPSILSVNQQLKRTYNDDPFQRVIFSDSHDTAANGSVRLNEAAGYGHAENVYAREQTILASALTLTTPGIPMFLQGQEFMQEGAFNDWQMLEWAKTDKFRGIVKAHQHLTALRQNTYENTAGLFGSSVSVFHYDETRRIIAYHRWKNGGIHDDTIIIMNFNGIKSNDTHTLTLPIAGTWQVRFNSSWKGYSPEFHEVEVSTVVTDENGAINIQLAPYGVLILSQD